MIWPPVKAWTSNTAIDGQHHFVAINFGGELLNRWVILMSVLDSSVVIKVSLSQLVDSTNWKTGWDEVNLEEFNKVVNNKGFVKTSKFTYPSSDSGLTIPICKNNIRPWFGKV